ARRATAPTAGGLPRGGRVSHDHQRARDRVGAPAGEGTTQPLGPATGYRAGVRPVPAHDRPGDRGATARCVPHATPPPHSLPVVCQRYLSTAPRSAGAAPPIAGGDPRDAIRT